MEIVLICGGLLVVVVIIALVSLKTKDSSTTGYARNSRSVKPAPRVVRPVYAKKTRTSSGLVPQSATAPLHGENEDKVSVRVSVSVADDPPPSQRPFLTEEVRLLAGAMRQPGGDDRLWNRRIHYSLGYGERAYGCSEKLNRECANSLDILDSVDPSEFGVPNSVTKAMIMEGLAARGVAFKKSAKRDDLLRLAWTCEGLVRELVDQVEPDFRVIKPEYAHEACVWADRNRRLIPFAQAVMAYMGLVRIGQTERRTTLDKVLENQAAMVCGEYNYGH